MYFHADSHVKAPSMFQNANTAVCVALPAAAAAENNLAAAKASSAMLQQLLHVPVRRRGGTIKWPQLCPAQHLHLLRTNMKPKLHIASESPCAAARRQKRKASA